MKNKNIINNNISGNSKHRGQSHKSNNRKASPEISEVKGNKILNLNNKFGNNQIQATSSTVATASSNNNLRTSSFNLNTNSTMYNGNGGIISGNVSNININNKKKRKRDEFEANLSQQLTIQQDDNPQPNQNPCCKGTRSRRRKLNDQVALELNPSD